MSFISIVNELRLHSCKHPVVIVLVAHDRPPCQIAFPTLPPLSTKRAGAQSHSIIRPRWLATNNDTPGQARRLQTEGNSLVPAEKSSERSCAVQKRWTLLS